MRTTNAAKLPALPRVSTGNPALDQWIQAATERLEVREGSRGNPNERAVTVREIRDLGFSGVGGGYRSGSSTPGSVLAVAQDGSYTALSPDAFAESIRGSKLYADLMRKLDSVTRFEGLPEQVKAILLTDLAAEAEKRGADIQRLERKLRSDTESLAYSVEEVTASVSGSMAGVRETLVATTTETSATTGKVTQLVASLDGTGSATIEDSLVVIADRTAGLSAQYMLKLGAGKSVAGMGLMASEDPTGATQSAFMVQAGQFALTAPFVFVQSATPTATAAGQTWYNTDTDLSFVAVAPGTGSWVSYAPTVPFGVDTATGKVFINGSLTVNAGGSSVADILASFYKDYVFKRAASAPAAPDTLSEPTAQGWYDAPPVGSVPLYMSSADRQVTGNAVTGAWSDPVRLDGSSGAEGRYTEAQYAVNSSTSVAPTSGFAPTQPSLSAGQYMWMQIRTVTPPAAPPAWGTAVRISGEQGSASTTPGPAGIRGTIVTKIAGAWSSAAAAAQIASIASAAGSTPTNPIKGDIVNYAGGAQECTTAGYPGTWAPVGAYIDGSMVVTGTLAANKVAAGILEGFTMQTGASGARYVLTGTSFQGYDSGGGTRVNIDMASGVSQFFSTGFGPAVSGTNPSGTGVSGNSQTGGYGVSGQTSTGAGVRGFALSTGVGVEGSSTSYIGGAFYGGSNAPALYINPNGSLPTSGAIQGSLCSVGGLLYFHNGSTWKQVSLL